MFLNTENSYGLVAIIIHWLIALTIIGLFFLGLWMVDLDYYHAWYITAPNIHRSAGLLLLFVLVFRLLWRFANPSPEPLPSLKRWEHVSAKLMHWTLYLLTLLIIVSGYMISTAEGQPVDVFGWFKVPATITSIENQEDIAGQVHYYLGVIIMVLAGFHALAALKHHFINKDATLLRMLGLKSEDNS